MVDLYEDRSCALHIPLDHQQCLPCGIINWLANLCYSLVVKVVKCRVHT